MYVENANEETLYINLFDKDSTGKGFLDYAFIVKDMSILETEQVEGLVYKMWDLGRHTMQTNSEFMRILNMKDKIKKFNLDVFSIDYSMTIESGDVFQDEFKFASNSVLLRVVSELFWPLMIGVTEFIVSEEIIQLRLRNEYDYNWIQDFSS